MLAAPLHLLATALAVGGSPCPRQAAREEADPSCNPSWQSLYSAGRWCVVAGGMCRPPPGRRDLGPNHPPGQGSLQALPQRALHRLHRRARPRPPGARQVLGTGSPHREIILRGWQGGRGVHGCVSSWLICEGICRGTSSGTCRGRCSPERQGQQVCCDDYWPSVKRSSSASMCKHSEEKHVDLIA